MPTDEWKSYQALVLSEIKRLGHTLEIIANEQRRLHSDIEVLKYKASLFGALSGILASFAAIIFEKIRN